MLFIPKLIHSYFLMPFPGSMDIETMTFSYWLDKVADFFLFTGTPVAVWGSIILLRNGNMLKKAGGLSLLGLTGAFYYFTLFEFNASRMFKEPNQVVFTQASLEDYNPNAYVLGISDEGVSKAYPVKYLAYHHKIHDRINGQDLLVTYCSMCRSGRIFSPVVEGEKVTFRLVGARHYNAIIEDSKTKTWWYQATGEGAAGPLKNTKLTEIPCEQTTWRAWKEAHPNTLLLQPDPEFTEIYDEWFATFDDMRSSSDSVQGSKKVWIAGFTENGQSAAYPIPAIIRQKVIHDQIGQKPFLITIGNDSLTTHVYYSVVDQQTLSFIMDSTWTFLKDKETNSVWNLSGLCTAGPYTGKQLVPKQHYNEYLRSWQQFHPHTKIWK